MRAVLSSLRSREPAGRWDAAAGRGRRGAARLAPVLILTGLGLLFFAELVLHPARVLYSDHSDFLAYQLPLERFLVGSWRETGEMPLWNPYSFAGMPMAHDIQVAAFYPLHLPLRLLPEARVGAVLSWLLVVHVLLAGWAMYALARSQGLGRTGGTVAALGWMFGGKWMLHLLAAGQYIQIGLAWLPLVLLGMERAIRRGSLAWATGAGVAFAMLVLATHPQLTFYAGLFAAAWTLAPALETAGVLGADGPRSRRRTAAALGRWLGFGAGTAVLAAGLAAIQLLPTLEAARWSSRGAVGLQAKVAVDLFVPWFGLAGPAPGGLPAIASWEYRSGLGVLWITAALLAPLLDRGGRVRAQAAAGLVLVLFALGGGVVLAGWPGFRLFRTPSRMFLIAALPIALLAGRATEALFDPAGSHPPSATKRRGILMGVLLAALASYLGAMAAATRPGEFRDGWYWASLLVTIPAAIWLLGAAPGAGLWDEGRLRIAWVLLLLVDLWSLSRPLVATRREADIFAPAACARFVAGRAGEQARVLDRDVPGRDGTTPLPSALAQVLRVEPVRGYNPLDIFRYKEFLQFVGGRDDPPRPANGVVNFPIRNQPLLELLGVRFLLEPSDPGRPSAAAAAAPRWREVFRDPDPVAYLFVEGGFRRLPSFSVYENPAAFPRAFVVPRAEPLPERSRVLEAFEANDFRRVVFLEGDKSEFRPPLPGGEGVRFGQRRHGPRTPAEPGGGGGRRHRARLPRADGPVVPGLVVHAGRSPGPAVPGELCVPRRGRPRGEARGGLHVRPVLLRPGPDRQRRVDGRGGRDRPGVRRRPLESPARA